jgi:hypothetical protein
MDELLDPTIDDAWYEFFSRPKTRLSCPNRKSVILSAYSNYDPQTAAAWASNMSSWGPYLPTFPARRP